MRNVVAEPEVCPFSKANMSYKCVQVTVCMVCYCLLVAAAACAETADYSSAAMTVHLGCCAYPIGIPRCWSWYWHAEMSQFVFIFCLGGPC